MIGATLYIVGCSARNRARQRLRRLREPRYLIGALVGAAYLFFAIVGRMRAVRMSSNQAGRYAAPAALLPGLAASGPALGGVFLLACAGAILGLPLASRLLDFTPAEMALLVPAPVSRRQLLVYRFVRAQWAVLLGAAVFALTYPVASVAARGRGLVAGWLLLTTAHVFFTGVTLARLDRVRRRGADALTRAPIAAVVVALAVVVAAVVGAAWQRPVESASAAIGLVADVCGQGLPRLVLLPFVALVLPLFSDSFESFVRALPAAVVVYGLAMAWVLHADTALDRATEESLERQVQNPPALGTAYRARPVGFTLALTGRPEGAFLWKGALQTFRIVDTRVLFRLAVVVASITAVVTLFGPARGLAQVLAVLAAIGSGFTALMAPQIVRLDLRQDLQHLELLKTWPVRPAAVVRGEIAWPTVVTTIGAWALALVAIALSVVVFPPEARSLRLAIAGVALILIPALVLAQYTVHNALALLFPAWVPMGRGRPRGLDAVGQRLILLGATSLMLILALVPGFVAGGMLWFAFHQVTGPWILIPGAVVTAGLVALEVLAATEALGSAYERIDLTSVERPE